MPKYTVYKTKVKHNGRFDFKEFYGLLYDTLASNGYIITSEDFAQKVTDSGEEVEVLWDFFKLIDDYTKFVVKAYFLINDLKEVIIKKGDKDVKSFTGSIVLLIEGTIITDHKGLWEQTPFLRKLRGFYEAYLFKRTLDSYQVVVYKDVDLFSKEMKSFFDLTALV